MEGKGKEKEKDFYFRTNLIQNKEKNHNTHLALGEIECLWHLLFPTIGICFQSFLLPLGSIRARLPNRIHTFSIIPAHRYYRATIFSCKYKIQSSCLSIIMFDIILCLELFMNRLMLDGTSIPSGSRIKM